MNILSVLFVFCKREYHEMRSVPQEPTIARFGFRRLTAIEGDDLDSGTFG